MTKAAVFIIIRRWILLPSGLNVVANTIHAFSATKKLQDIHISAGKKMNLIQQQYFAATVKQS